MRQKHLNTKSSYKMYVENSKNPIDSKTYVKIVNGFIQHLVERLFITGGVMFPQRLGNLSVIGKKVKVKIEDGKIVGLAPDWQNTKKLWARDPEARENKQLVYHFNEHTNSIRYRFFWSKARALMANKTLFTLKMTRTNKRKLAKLIKSGKEYLITK